MRRNYLVDVQLTRGCSSIYHVENRHPGFLDALFVEDARGSSPSLSRLHLVSSRFCELDTA